MVVRQWLVLRPRPRGGSGLRRRRPRTRHRACGRRVGVGLVVQHRAREVEVAPVEVRLVQGRAPRLDANAATAAGQPRRPRKREVQICWVGGDSIKMGTMNERNGRI